MHPLDLVIVVAYLAAIVVVGFSFYLVHEDDDPQLLKLFKVVQHPGTFMEPPEAEEIFVAVHSSVIHVAKEIVRSIFEERLGDVALGMGLVDDIS